LFYFVPHVWTQVSRTLLVDDVKIRQLGSKNLIVCPENPTVRFDTYQIGGGKITDKTQPGNNLIPRVDFRA
jgi:hypothetical protein